MNNRDLTRNTSRMFVVTCALLMMLLSSCQAPNVPLDHTQDIRTTEKPYAQTTQVPAQAPPNSIKPPAGTSLAFSDIAQDFVVETIAAVPPDSGGPGWWEVAPQHTRISLQGYPISNHIMKPQIFIYPVKELGKYNEAAGRMADDLQALLQVRQPGVYMPFLPLSNTSQVMHIQEQYLDFKNGQGVRFLIQLAQGPTPINNYELFYSYQGLTSDGNYYISAILPITHPELPSNSNVSHQQTIDLDDFFVYLENTIFWLEQQPGGSFTLDLATLDALIQSIEVR
jgi:hypothetical protein